MRSTLALLAALSVVALAPAAAGADAPWSAPVTIPGAAGYNAPVVFTAAGNGAVATARPSGGQAATLLTSISADGALDTGRDVALSSARLVAYASDHIALAGTRPASTGAQARTAPVLLGTGTPSGGVGTPKALPDTGGQQLLALAGSPGGGVALVTGTSRGHRERIVWVRKGSSVRRALTISVGDRARGAAVAVGRKGDVLVVWEDRHRVFTRHIGPSGSIAPVHDLGAGVQSSLQAAFDDSGRQEVAWLSQRVDEGDALTPATISYTSAAKGHGFTRAVVIGGDDPVGTGRYVTAPGVRLVPSGTDSSVLALTVYDGSNFRAATANAAGGRVQPIQTVSPEGEDAVLGDLAYARAGGTLVLWRSGTAGNDPRGPQRVFASYRPAGTSDFTGREAVSDPAGTVPYAPFAAVAPETG